MSLTQRAAIVSLLLVSLGLNGIGLSWGLPNGNRTWAADALQPLTPLAVGKRVWFGEPWNSGWFYFKYPVGHPNLLLGFQAPVLAWMRWNGEVGRLQSEYPHGFRNPERSLMLLALVTRVVSALMGTATVVLFFFILRTYLSLLPSWLAALSLAGSAPFVFYSHTSNVDVPLLFWLMLALWAVIRSARSGAMWATVLAGTAAAMALLTKEQGVGFLLALPAVWALQRPRNGAPIPRHLILAALAFVGTTVCVANVFWNPSGYFNRWRFLMGTLPEDIRRQYAPYQFFTQLPGTWTLQQEAQKARKVLESVARSLPPGAGGIALFGIGLLAWRARRFAAICALIAAGYYAASLRALELVPTRYTLPVVWIGCAGLGVCVGTVWEAWARSGGVALRIGKFALLACCAWMLAAGIEVDRLLLKDPRYRAEAWLKNLGGEKRVEVYQPETYLPRFPSTWTVQRVSLPERRIDRFSERSPDLVVLSSGGKAGLFGRYASSWKPGEPVFAESDAARELIGALRSGELGYHAGPVFSCWTWLDHRIHSLNPTIEVYTREPVS